jgi:hypothetical protein
MALFFFMSSFPFFSLPPPSLSLLPVKFPSQNPPEFRKGSLTENISGLVDQSSLKVESYATHPHFDSGSLFLV